MRLRASLLTRLPVLLLVAVFATSLLAGPVAAQQAPAQGQGLELTATSPTASFRLAPNQFAYAWVTTIADNKTVALILDVDKMIGLGDEAVRFDSYRATDGIWNARSAAIRGGDPTTTRALAGISGRANTPHLLVISNAGQIAQTVQITANFSPIELTAQDVGAPVLQAGDVFGGRLDSGGRPNVSRFGIYLYPGNFKQMIVSWTFTNASRVPSIVTVSGNQGYDGLPGVSYSPGGGPSSTSQKIGGYLWSGASTLLACNGPVQAMNLDAPGALSLAMPTLRTGRVGCTTQGQGITKANPYGNMGVQVGQSEADPRALVYNGKAPAGTVGLQIFNNRYSSSSGARYDVVGMGEYL